ncbi:MAG: radical SAM family heme chaperone HemW, partial [Candidatus Dadabacteria bacterium]
MLERNEKNRKKRDKSFSLYIHIPFCKRLCPYCDFTAYTKKEFLAPYLKALKKEIKTYSHSPLFEKRTVATIYFGGGTPSILPAQEIKEIIDVIKKSFNVKAEEITLEANPEDVLEEKALAWQKSGVNRVSIGAQSFNKNILKFLGRKHRKEQIKKAVELCQQSGINNISIDLIIGTKYHTKELLKKELEEALALNPSHLSVYLLTYSRATPFSQKRAEDLLAEEEEAAEELFYTEEFLSQRGFKRYEVSNYSKEGKKSQHN